MNQLLFVAITIIIAACSTQAPPPIQTASAEATKSVEAELPTPSEPEVIEDTDAADETIVKAAEIPRPPEAELPAELGIVCTREYPTGSHLSVEVCRHQSEIVRRQQADRDVFDRIKTNTAIGTSQLPR